MLVNGVAKTMNRFHNWILNRFENLEYPRALDG